MRIDRPHATTPLAELTSVEGLVQHMVLEQDDAARADRADARRQDAAHFAAAERALAARSRASKLALAGELVGHVVQLGTSLAGACAQGRAGSSATGASGTSKGAGSEGASRLGASLTETVGGLVRTGLGHAGRRAEASAAAATLRGEQHERLAADARERATEERSVRDRLLQSFEAAASAAREGDRIAAGRG